MRIQGASNNAELVVESDGSLNVNTTMAASTAPQTVACGTVGNLLATVNCGTAANLLSTVSGTVIVTSGTAANLLAQVSQGTATNLLAQVSQGTAANLLCTVTGTVAVNAVTGTVTVNALVASTATVGHTVVHNELNTYFAGTTTVAPSYAAVAITASGDNTIVSGVASKKIYVLSGVLMSSTVTNLKFWTVSTAGTALSGLMYVPAQGGFQIPYNPVGAIATNQTGVALILNSSAASTVGGFITYVVV